MYVNRKTLPESLLSALDSVQFFRPDIQVETCEEIDYRENANDGMRAFVVAVNLATGEREAHLGSWGGENAFTRNAVDSDEERRPMRAGFAIVKGSSGSRGCFARIYLHPSNAVGLLPEKRELSERQQEIIGVLASLNPRGRKEYWERRGAKPSDEEISSLVELGLVNRNKAGALSLTTEGKNARDKSKSYY